MLYRLYLVCLTAPAHCFFHPTSDERPNSAKHLQIILNRWTVDLRSTFSVSLKEGAGWQTRNVFTGWLKMWCQRLPPPSLSPQINTLVPPDTVCMILAVPSPMSIYNGAALTVSTSLIWDISSLLPCGKIAGCGSSLQLCSHNLACTRSEAPGVLWDTLSLKGGTQSSSFSAFQKNICLNDVCVLY